MSQVYTGLFTEGNSDVAFLKPIVERTLMAIALECSGQIDIEVVVINITKSGLGFSEQILEVSKKGLEEIGVHFICIHADADNPTAQNTYQNKIIPAKNLLNSKDSNTYCKLFSAIVPVYEMESWMLADKNLLKSEIGTNQTDIQLGIHKNPESISNPKEIIETAIRIARSSFTSRRRKDLTIADLYLPIGQSVDLLSLESLPSYLDFKQNVRDSFKALNLLF